MSKSNTNDERRLQKREFTGYKAGLSSSCVKECKPSSRQMTFEDWFDRWKRRGNKDYTYRQILIIGCLATIQGMVYGWILRGFV